MAAERIPATVAQPVGIGEDPLYYFTRSYVAFLQGLFGQFPEGSYKWSEDEGLSEIRITDQVPLPRDAINQRPHLVTMRGPAQWSNLSLDNLQAQDVQTGQRRHSDLVACTMTINAVAKNGVEAQRLAWIVFSNLRIHNRLLQRHVGIHQVGNMMSMGPESTPGALVQPEPDPEMVMVTVQSPFYFKWTYEITPRGAVRAQGIEAHLTAKIGGETSKLHENSTLLRRPSIRGIPLPVGKPIDRVGVTQTVTSNDKAPA